MHIRRTFASALPLLWLPVAALAHPGHPDSAWAAGALHPLTGADHLAALVAVGAWSAGQCGRARILVPSTFVAFMALGGVLAPTLGVAPSHVEQGIAASLLVTGLLLALRTRLSLPLAATLAAAFASFHGAAHGLEAPAASTGFTGGFLAMSSALIVAGFAAASLIARSGRGPALRLGGALLAGGGLWLLA